MQRNYRRPAFALGLVAAAAVMLALIAGVSGGQSVAKKSPKLFGDTDRAALKNRMSQSRPGHEGSRQRISEITNQELVDRAAPLKTLPFAFRRGARDYFTHNIEGRGNEDNSHGWQLAGPSTATYPAVLNRTDASYVASGRVTAMAIAPTCTGGNCRVWMAAAGGGVWRTDNALATTPDWKFISGGFGTNAIGSLLYDAPHHTLYAGTGEPNSSGDSEAGIGIYKSTDDGSHWSFISGSAAISSGNSIASIAISSTGDLYVATTLGVRGVSGNSGGAVLDPNAPAPGLYKSTDGGQTFSLVYDDSATAYTNGWGVNHVEIDGHGDVYMAAESEGVFRSKNGGATWELVFATQDVGSRTEFALTTVNPGNHTRIYVGDGGSEYAFNGVIFDSTSGVYRGDNMDTTNAGVLTDGTGNPGYESLTSPDRTNPKHATWDYCWVQCSYDNFVVTPAGNPDVVYVGGAYDYNFAGTRNNGRAVLLSLDAGEHWGDQTWDAQSPTNGIHPDQHALVTSPSNPKLFFEGSDGGVVRSSGDTTDISAQCDGRPLSTNSRIACKNILSMVPTQLYSLNAGLSTLQFGTVSVDPRNVKHLQGGTQDNGTWEGTAGNQSWGQTMYGDGGQSGFDIGNSHLRFNNFYSPYLDVNFQDGAAEKWVIASGTFFDPTSGNPKELSAFYMPVINDPKVAGTIYAGLGHVWRTQDWGGNQANLEANCPEFTTFGGQPGCGDFAPLGDPAGQGLQGTAGDLTGSSYGTDKHYGNDYVVRVARTASDSSSMWAATRRGRVFISTNADAAAASVSFTRIDTPAQPMRFVSGLVIDPNNRYHAYVSFGGYNAATPTTPGHVFDVVYNPLTHTATWTALDRGVGPLGDLPVTDLALDANTGRLYAATDFNVLVQKGKSGKWQLAAPGMPMVEVSGLTLDSKNRVLYAATHGRAIWSLQLQNDGGGDNNNGRGGGDHNH